MGLKAGTMTRTYEAFAAGMADAMLHAMEQEWQHVKGTPLPATGREDLKLIFTAVAQGVVRHLKNNQDAFQILGADTVENINIQTEGVLHPFEE